MLLLLGLVVAEERPLATRLPPHLTARCTYVPRQDVYKRLSTPSRSGCLLRLRTSPELQPLRCHPASWAVPDEQHPQLFHVVAASADDAFIFELRRTSAPLRGTPAVQLVSQGSTVQAAPDGRRAWRGRG